MASYLHGGSHGLEISLRERGNELPLSVRDGSMNIKSILQKLFIPKEKIRIKDNMSVVLKTGDKICRKH